MMGRTMRMMGRTSMLLFTKKSNIPKCDSREHTITSMRAQHPHAISEAECEDVRQDKQDIICLHYEVKFI